jgi:peptide/nickel transport system permease protein
MSVTVELPAARTGEAVRRRGVRGGYWQGVLRRLRRDPVTVGCALIVLTIVALAIAAPLVAPADPYRTSMLNRLLAPGAPHHVLGTDELGRDMLTRLIYGGRLSLFMGLTPVINALLIGGALGILAGYVGGAVNTGIMRTLEVFFAFPSVLLAISLSGAMGAGIGNTILSLTIVFIAPIGRVAEAVTTQIRNLDYIEAARASGAGALAIMRVHVLRVVLGPIFIYASSLISVSIILASGLSFLGLGVKPPEPEWGLMLNTLRAAIYTSPVNATLPGVMIFITSICFNLVSDGLRGAMDVKE